MKKTIITVDGKDTVGIIANICTYLANNKINVLGIPQTSNEEGNFHMTMVVDANQSAKTEDELLEELEQIGEEIGVEIRCDDE